MEDLNLALRHDASGRLQCIKDLLSASAPALDYDHRQLMGQINGRMNAAAPNNAVLLQEWLNQYRNVAVTCLVPTRVFLPATEDGSEDGAGAGGSGVISAIYRLSSDHHAAALSSVKNEMTLWDFRTGHRDKVLVDLHQPLKVAPLANNRCVVLSGRELRVYDIATGDELLKLKGNSIRKIHSSQAALP